MGKVSVLHGQHNRNGVSESKPPVHHGKGSGKRKGGGGGESGRGIKVVYISSPMKLTVSAEEFGAVVQELTGRDSNMAVHDAPAGVPSYYSPLSWSTSSPSYSSFRRASPMTAGDRTAARVLPPAMVASSTPEYMTAAGAMPPPFQSMYDQPGGAGQVYGQDYYW